MKAKVQRISEKDYEKIFIMTDIHGRYDLFEKIFGEISYTKKNSHMKCIENILICRMKAIK